LCRAGRLLDQPQLPVEYRSPVDEAVCDSKRALHSAELKYSESYDFRHIGLLKHKGHFMYISKYEL